MNSKLASRKFILSCSMIIILTGVLCFDKISEDNYSYLITLIISGYLIANLSQTVVLKKENKDVG